MLGVAGRRDHASDGRFRQDVFEEQLRPAYAVEFLRPVGQRAAAHPAKQIAALERLIGDDSDAARRGNRQQLGLGRAHRQRIAELDEIDVRFSGEDVGQLG